MVLRSVAPDLVKLIRAARFDIYLFKRANVMSISSYLFRTYQSISPGGIQPCNMREEKKEVFYQRVQNLGRSAHIALEIPPIERACNSESETMSRFFSESS